MNRKNKKVTVWVAETALLLALLVVVQLLTFTIPKGFPLVSQFFTGTLVNMALIVGTGSVGLSGTAVAAVISPLLAYAFGQMIFPQMIPVVAVGNLIIVVVLWLFFHPSADAEAPGLCRSVLGIVVGAAVKTMCHTRFDGESRVV
jgi:nitrate/nitrite transporter NarK